MNEQEKLIEEQKKKLPPELLEAIEGMPWKNVLQEIGGARGLSADQMISLEQETILIIYGFVNPTEYPSNLVREVGIDEATATDISDSVWEKIMEPISKKVESNNLSTQETSAANLPMIEPDFAQGSVMVKPGEVAHEVPHVESTINNKQFTIKPEQPKVSIPDYRYDGGKDPYREPLK